MREEKSVRSLRLTTRLQVNLFLQIWKFLMCLIVRSTLSTGLKIATDMVANATNIFSLATKNSSWVAKVATRFLYDLDLN